MNPVPVTLCLPIRLSNVEDLDACIVRAGFYRLTATPISSGPAYPGIRGALYARRLQPVSFANVHQSTVPFVLLDARIEQSRGEFVIMAKTSRPCTLDDMTVKLQQLFNEITAGMQALSRRRGGEGDRGRAHVSITPSSSSGENGARGRPEVVVDGSSSQSPTKGDAPAPKGPSLKNMDKLLESLANPISPMNAVNGVASEEFIQERKLARMKRREERLKKRRSRNANSKGQH